MLCRVSCELCGLYCWTDDPGAFITSLCARPRRCRARVVDEKDVIGPASTKDARVVAGDTMVAGALIESLSS
jgi:hypothetical protein